METVEIQFFAEDLTAGDEPLGRTTVSIESAVMGLRPKPPAGEEEQQQQQPEEDGRFQKGPPVVLEFEGTTQYSRELRAPGWHPPWVSGVQGAVEFSVTWTEAPPVEQGGLWKFSRLGDDVELEERIKTGCTSRAALLGSQLASRMKPLWARAAALLRSLMRLMAPAMLEVDAFSAARLQADALLPTLFCLGALAFALAPWVGLLPSLPHAHLPPFEVKVAIVLGLSTASVKAATFVWVVYPAVTGAYHVIGLRPPWSESNGCRQFEDFNGAEAAEGWPEMVAGARGAGAELVPRLPLDSRQAPAAVLGGLDAGYGAAALAVSELSLGRGQAEEGEERMEGEEGEEGAEWLEGEEGEDGELGSMASSRFNGVDDFLSLAEFETAEFIFTDETDDIYTTEIYADEYEYNGWSNTQTGGAGLERGVAEEMQGASSLADRINMLESRTQIDLNHDGLIGGVTPVGAQPDPGGTPGNAPGWRGGVYLGGDDYV